MIMKIITYVAIALLIITLGTAAVFYLNVFKPMEADYASLKEKLPSLEKAKADLRQYRENESKEKAWLSPAADILGSGMNSGIKLGKAEVLIAGDRVIVNIAEDDLYMPGATAFSKQSPQLLQTLVSLLQKNEFQGKLYIIGNTTENVPPRGRGKNRVRAKEARSLAAERSLALIKFFEKNGVSQDALIAAAYSSNQPYAALNLKSRKTVIIIENPPAATQSQLKLPTGTVSPEADHQPQPRPIPIQPAQPKAH